MQVGTFSYSVCKTKHPWDPVGERKPESERERERERESGGKSGEEVEEKGVRKSLWGG